jgi:hypothetical protein
MEKAHEALNEIFGFSSFRLSQEEVGDCSSWAYVLGVHA